MNKNAQLNAADPLRVDLDKARKAYSPKAGPAEIQRNFDYDMSRFIKHSSTHILNQDPLSLSSWLVSAFHGVEKGLTMETAKEGFALKKNPTDDGCC